MKLIDNIDIYYNTQVYFRNNCMDSLPNDDKAWAAAYRDWLKSQGATIVHGAGDLIKNSLGFCPFFDKFGFEHNSDFTMFLLKWS
jgi:hypothetical protein